ncbi:hypothetical protein O5O45_06420 [Hahella aquimaris]|uniref:hypothetical protein n=1 Tax=Hahella sp. HNIBRBA332 TaxID=3015983 RepID=UPI00273C1FA7|nr:hypothetical protein [Hahella sp. HNIBRBA332]WLQ15553.1 hypothetical protein O5O45_06420 [Hahella sp. HNIBRBA332]
MNKDIWLIYHKSSLSPRSSINMDGSDFMVGVSAVPAREMMEAIELFKEHLREDYMAPMELWKCVKWGSGDYGLESEIGADIEESVTLAQASNTTITTGISSEFLADLEEELVVVKSE